MRVRQATPFEDRALLLIQGLVDNPTVGRHVINAHWREYRLGADDGSFLLGDRPLIRIAGYSDPKCIWSLPLSSGGSLRGGERQGCYRWL
jgi:hypothetical protein